jgi:hypothetical protein
MRRIALLIGLALASLSCFGQNDNNYSKGFVYIGALASIPSRCSVGSIAFVTDATAGQNIYECAAANTWTQQSGGAGGSPTGSAGGDLGSTYPNPTVVGMDWAGTTCNFAASPITVSITADTSFACDASGGNIVLNLPASTNAGRVLFFYKFDSSANTVTINRNGANTIEGAASVVLATQWDSLELEDKSPSGGTWAKVSPKIPGSSGNLMWNNNFNFAGLTGSTVDNITDLSTGSSNQIALTRTWTVGHASNAGHAIDATADYTGTTAVENTITGAYIRSQIHANNSGGGGNGISHMLTIASRTLDSGTGTAATLVDVEGVYEDLTDTASSTSAITKYTGFYKQTNPFSTTLARTIADHTAFRSDLATFPGAGTTITKEQQIDVPVRASTTAQVTSSYAVNIGRVAHIGQYLALLVGGEQSEFQAPIYHTMTMGAASVAPVTVSQPYLIKQSGLVADTTAVVQNDFLLTHGNAATGTSILLRAVNDNGGSGTPTKQTAIQAQTKSTGAPNTSTKQIAFEVLAPANSSATITDISGLEIPSLASGTNTNQPQAIKQIGSTDISTFAGPMFWNGNKAFVNSSEFTTSGSGTALEAITGLTFTLPTNTAENVSFSCNLVYHQNTGTAAVAFGVKNSVSPTNVSASAEMYTSTTAFTAGNLQTLASTTATAVVSATPSVITTNWNVNMRGFIENPSGAANTFTILVSTATAADTVTIRFYRACPLTTTPKNSKT